jgi:hypothetical protein
VPLLSSPQRLRKLRLHSWSYSSHRYGRTSSCRLLWCCQLLSQIKPRLASALNGRFISAFMTQERQSCLISSLQALAADQNMYSLASFIGPTRATCTRILIPIQLSALQTHRTSLYAFPLPPNQPLGRHGATSTLSDTPKNYRRFHKCYLPLTALPMHQKRSDTRSDSQIPRC